MKIFVIGATGFVGSHVAARFVAAGHDVFGLARSVQGAEKVSRLNATPVIGDAEDLEALVKHAGACDATIFAPQLMQQQEQDAVTALLDRYKGSGKIFIFTSGTGVVGQRTDGEWSEDTFAEDDPFVGSKYLTQRRETERLVRAAAADNVRAMVIRPPMIWGHGVHGIVAAVNHAVEQTGSACYIGRGLNLYTHVHVDDLADLFWLALEKGTAGALYHAAAGELNNRVLAEYVARQRGVETRSVLLDEAFEIWGKFTTLIVLSVSSRTRSPRSRNELGWKPTRLDLADAILAGKLNGPKK
jgi:nucleoside-diphosphate-sugar epimerase